MKTNLNLNPVYRTMPLSVRYALSANGWLGRMTMRRDKPVNGLLHYTQN